MRIDDFTIEVRNDSYERVGQIPDYYLPGAQFILRFNNVGSWTLTMPYGEPLVDLLRTPGYGIVVRGPGDDVIFSGPTLAARLDQTPEDPKGVWTLEGSDDTILLQERLAYPDPATDDVTAQTTSHDRRTGDAETVIKGYVNANIGPGAPVSRRVSGLVIGTNLNRGATVSQAARFTQLQELVYGIAESAGLGYNIEQVGDELVFDVYEPSDLSSFIRFDVENDLLRSAEYGYVAPEMTRTIVGGQGEAIERLFIERSNTDSTAAETLWGRRIEVFTDARQAAETAELEQAGDEALADGGKTIVSINATPTDDVQMLYGVDWNLGDIVAITAGDVETTATVTEVGISIDSDGVRIGATVGTPAPVDFESKLVSRVVEHEERISSLERNTTGYGVNTVYEPEGGTDGTQPTASGSFITGSYNRFGNMVHFNIQVDMDNITSFGTGHYYVTLPYPARVRYTFTNGHLFDDSTGESYNFVGECAANSDQILLYYIGSNGRMDPFTYNSPVTLTVDDYFDISGTYEIEG